jgi:hypothetical protein
MEGTAMTAPREETSKPKRRRSRKYSAEPLAPIPDNDESLGPCMRLLNAKQRRFIWELKYGPVGYGSEVRAARAAGYGTPTSSDGSMRVLAHQALHSPRIQDALREVGAKIIRAEAFQSIRNVTAIASDLKHRDCLKANIVLMDRGGFAPETVHHVVVQHVDHDAEAVGELRMLKSVGVARERLEKLFGKNGLTRFERLAALEDARASNAAKVINADESP